jgi:hypothetical protein
VDIPGERLTRLVAKDFRSVKSVIAAMDMCGALIVALPADEVLLSEDVQREAQVLRGVDHVLLKRTADNPDLHRLALKARQLVVEAGSVEDAIGGQGPQGRRDGADPRARRGQDRGGPPAAAARRRGVGSAGDADPHLSLGGSGFGAVALRAGSVLHDRA